MSNALQKLRKRKGNKPRRGINGRTRRATAKGAAKVERLAPPKPDIPVPEDGRFDMTKANPSCKRCHGTGWGAVIVKDSNREKLVCLCVTRGMSGSAPWLKRGYHRTVYDAATELAEGRITKAEFEIICKAAWVKHRGPVPEGRQLCVELRGEEIVIGHSPLPKVTGAAHPADTAGVAV